MTKKLVEHELFGYVLLDTETQTYECIYKQTVNFENNGKKTEFFNSTVDFLNSESKMCVIPFICVEHTSHKRRTYVEIIDINNYSYKFFNVELIDSRWIENKISNFIKGRCYFVLLQKDIRAMNDCRLLSCMEIKKGVYGEHTP